jgi:hypothetical protein
LRLCISLFDAEIARSSFVTEIKQNIMEKAESRFLETQKKAEGSAKGTIQYQTEAKLRAVKTARLRELRLAKDEAERAAEALRPAAPKKKRASHR